jgi:hypothetical protein
MRSSSPSGCDAGPNLRHVGDPRPNTQGKPRDAEKPCHGLEIGRPRDVACAEQEAWHREHQQQGGDLSEVGHIQARHLVDDGGDRHHQPDEHLASKYSNRKPDRYRAIDDDCGEGDDEEQSVDSWVKDFAELAHLIESPRDVTIDPIGGAQSTEYPCGCRPVVEHEQHIEEDREAEKTNKRDRIRECPNIAEHRHWHSGIRGACGRLLAVHVQERMVQVMAFDEPAIEGALA